MQRLPFLSYAQRRAGRELGSASAVAAAIAAKEGHTAWHGTPCCTPPLTPATDSCHTPASRDAACGCCGPNEEDSR